LNWQENWQSNSPAAAIKAGASSLVGASQRPAAFKAKAAAPGLTEGFLFYRSLAFVLPDDFIHMIQGENWLEPRQRKMLVTAQGLSRTRL